MKRLFFLILLIPASSLFGQAVNDECVNRTVISPGVGGFNEFSIDTSTATESLDASCETASQNNLDVWYEFTMPVTGNLRVTNVPSTVRSVLYDSCGGTELVCINDDGFFYSLTGGTTYVFRLSERDLFAGNVNFRLEAIATATNDECANRTAITVLTSDATEVVSDFRAATESVNGPCETDSQEQLDLWYEFTMPVNGNIRITGIPSTIYRTLYDICGGTVLSCSNDDGFYYDLTVGTTYVLRMSQRALFASDDTFSIQAFETAANDECANRDAISIAQGSPTNVPLDFRAGTESVNGPCETDSNQQLDLWYEFTMPIDGNVRITGIPSTIYRTIYDACGGSELVCGNDDGFFYELTSGTTYVLRMSQRALFANPNDFNIEPFATATNDECADRTLIVVGTGTTTNVPVDFRAATESVDGSCETASNIQQDLWYEFTMPVNGNIRITNIPSTIYRTLYDACEGTELLCGNDDGYFYNLTSGTSYVLRMSQREIFANANDFDIQAFEQAVNDECADRTLIAVVTGTTTNVPVDFRAATESVDGSCETASNIQQDLWYEFTMPVNGNIRITNIPSTIYRTLYDACGGTELLCGNDDGYFYNLTSGTSYVLRMSQWEIFANANDFDIQAFEQAVNDECATAIEMVVGTVSPISYDVDVRTATESTDSSCETVSNINLDVWYTVEMPVDGSLDFSGVPSTFNFTLYDSCSGSELDCFNNDGSFTGLTAGQELLVRLSERALFSNPRTVTVIVTPEVLPACGTTTTFSAGTWSAGAPDKGVSAVIADDYDTAAFGSIVACECTIEPGSTLTVNTNDYLQTSYNITVDGSLIVEHEGSVVQADATATTINNGSISVNKTTPVLAAKDFMIMASPMSVESRDGVYTEAWRVYGHNAANFSPNPDVTTAFPLAENFIDDNGDDRILLGPTDGITVGTGYLVFPQATPLEAGLSYNLSYTQGSLNSGNIAFPITYNGSREASFNLMGNPYASAIDAVDFIQANAMIDAVYFWEHNTSPSAGLPGYLNVNYSMEDVSLFNLTGGIAAASSPTVTPKRYIASGQGFAIKATAAGTAEFNNGMRRNFGNDTFRSVDVIPVDSADRLWLTLRSDAYELSSTTLLGFIPGASEGLDNGYDSRRLATYISLYSHTRAGDELGIQAIDSFEQNAIIYLGMSSQLRGQQQFTLSKQDLSGALINRAELFLLDTFNGKWTDLSMTDYHFIASEGNHPFRFELHFELPSAIMKTDLTAKVFPNPTSGSIQLQAEQPITNVTLYDMLGRVLWSAEGPDTTFELDLSLFPKATYLLRYKTAGVWQVKQIVRQ